MTNSELSAAVGRQRWWICAPLFVATTIDCTVAAAKFSGAGQALAAGVAVIGALLSTPAGPRPGRMSFPLNRAPKPAPESLP